MEVIAYILKMSQRKEKLWGMANKYSPGMKKRDLSRASSNPVMCNL